jgi:hypothetical protein
MAANKGVVDKVEETLHGERRLGAAAQHGDRALALIGDERVSLTDEDVCLVDPDEVLAWAYFVVEQANPPSNRQSHTGHSRLGVLPADSRQDGTGIWCDIRVTKNESPNRQPIFPSWQHCAHCSAGMATLLILPDRESPSPDPDAVSVPRLGHCADCNGGLSFVWWSYGGTLLPRTF